MDSEFPPNSHGTRGAGHQKPKAEREPEKKTISKVVTGRVVERKRPLYQKFFDAFRPEDNKGFLEHMLVDVLAPGLRDAFSNAAHDMIDNTLGGYSGGRGYTHYQSMSRSRRDRREPDDDRRPRRRHYNDDPIDISQFIVESKVEADHILDLMFETLSRFKAVTLKDLKSALGVPHEFTDNDWGWIDLRGAGVHRVRGGYLLDLPRPEALD